MTWHLPEEVRGRGMDYGKETYMSLPFVETIAASPCLVTERNEWGCAAALQRRIRGREREERGERREERGERREEREKEQGERERAREREKQERENKRIGEKNVTESEESK
jgi:hypothetical protein